MLTAKTLPKFGLLILAWMAHFYVLTFITQLTFTPWDGAVDWPEVGTWQRTLNDFFASDPGRLSLSVPFILISIYLTFSTVGRTTLSGGGNTLLYVPHPQPLPEASGRGENAKFRCKNDFLSAKNYLHRLVLCYPTVRIHPEKLNRLIGLSWLFIPILLLTSYTAIMLNNAIHPYPPVIYDPNYRGFHLTIIPGAALVGLCVLWLRRWQTLLAALPANNLDP